MSPEVTIQSDGPPPERHADRVIAAMIRSLAQKQARIVPAVDRAFLSSRDGGPRAQQRMAERIKRAGALRVDLNPGKRGKYQMLIHEIAGFDPATDKPIKVGDRIPPKPWLVYLITMIERRSNKTVGPLFVTHHALSRAAQRFGLKTEQHMIALTMMAWEVIEREIEQKEDFEVPARGRRLALGSGATAVIQRHEKYNAPVVVTLLIDEEAKP